MSASGPFLSSPSLVELWCKLTRNFHQMFIIFFPRVLSPVVSLCKCAQEKVRRRMYFLQTRWHHTDPATTTTPDKGSPRKCLEGRPAAILILFKLEREQEGGRSSMSRCADCRQGRRESSPWLVPHSTTPCELGSVQEAARDRLVKPFKLPGW